MVRLRESLDQRWSGVETGRECGDQDAGREKCASRFWAADTTDYDASYQNGAFIRADECCGLV